MNNLVIVRGGGDLASGTILKLYRCGFRVLVLETPNPTCIRRSVSFGAAVYERSVTLEGVTSVLVKTPEAIQQAWETGQIPVLVDETCQILSLLQPMALIDAIIAKKNLGTNRSMAPITIALGPGFQAGVDVDIVIETNRGHNLGRLIFQGSAAKDTGTPGTIQGYSKERVIYSENAGILIPAKKIGDLVQAGEVLATIGGTEIRAAISGVLRGLLQEGIQVPEGFKIADIDPRIEAAGNCFTSSDKANALGGAVLEALLIGMRKHGFKWEFSIGN